MDAATALNIDNTVLSKYSRIIILNTVDYIQYSGLYAAYEYSGLYAALTNSCLLTNLIL